jgi:hypothetical protein
MLENCHRPPGTGYIYVYMVYGISDRWEDNLYMLVHTAKLAQKKSYEQGM